MHSSRSYLPSVILIINFDIILGNSFVAVLSVLLIAIYKVANNRRSI